MQQVLICLQISWLLSLVNKSEQSYLSYSMNLMYTVYMYFPLFFQQLCDYTKEILPQVYYGL